MKKPNIILMADSYKYSHWLQLPPGTEYLTSYIEARGSDDEDFEETLFFGLQMFIKKYLLTPITQEMVDEAAEIVAMHGLPFNREGWEIIVNEFDGKLPLKIESVAEGNLIPLQNVLVQVTNTDPRFAWLTSFIETILLRDVWYPTSVATLSWKIKQLMQETYERTGSVGGIDFKLHDFGNRGVSSNESAEMGGLAHLINFLGTDTVPALIAGREYYDIDMAGFSIIAAEHATITPWGKENEEAAYSNIINNIVKEQNAAMVAIVADSYDLKNAVSNIFGDSLKDDIINSGATVVIRPDSGDPTIIPIEVIELLMEKFGYTTNDKGFCTLPDYIRVIQGDGINKESIKEILKNLEANKMTLDNLAFGMGGALLQQLNRDTFKFAMKANEIVINGEKKDVFKRPVTDLGKASKAGRQALIVDDRGIMRSIREDELNGEYNYLQPVYLNGELITSTTFDAIRTRAS